VTRARHISADYQLTWREYIPIWRAHSASGPGHGDGAAWLGA